MILQVAEWFGIKNELMANPIMVQLAQGIVKPSFNVDALPSSLVDSIESLKWKQQESKELGHAPWLATFWG
jgi:hypothetical protein